MKLKNQQIYNYATAFATFDVNVLMPVRINFYLQKNIRLIKEAAKEIEHARLLIGARFGTVNAAGAGYDIPSENIPAANKELQDLFDLEQDLNIHIFNLDDFDGIELTYQQMSAIMFMIEE